MPYKNYEDYKNWKKRNPEKVREYIKTSNQKHRESINLWWKNHPQKRNEKLRNWRKLNPEKAFVLRANYRTRLKNTEGNFTFKEWEQKKKEFDYTCPMCERREPEVALTIDHFIPISKSGTNWIYNIQPLCKNCNSIKHNKIMGSVTQ